MEEIYKLKEKDSNLREKQKINVSIYNYKRSKEAKKEAYNEIERVEKQIWENELKTSGVKKTSYKPVSSVKKKTTSKKSSVSFKKKK